MSEFLGSSLRLLNQPPTLAGAVLPATPTEDLDDAVYVFADSSHLDSRSLEIGIINGLSKRFEAFLA